MTNNFPSVLSLSTVVCRALHTTPSFTLALLNLLARASLAPLWNPHSLGLVIPSYLHSARLSKLRGTWLRCKKLLSTYVSRVPLCGVLFTLFSVSGHRCDFFSAFEMMSYQRPLGLRVGASASARYASVVGLSMKLTSCLSCICAAHVQR